jgi:hypothetical protein
MFPANPLTEPVHVIPDLFVVGMEEMGAVTTYANSGGHVNFIVDISSDVVPFLNHEDICSSIGATLRDSGS